MTETDARGLSPLQPRKAMRTAIASACFGAIGQIMVSESSILILYAGMLGASRFVSICTTSLQQVAQFFLYIPVAYLMSRYGKKRMVMPALTIGTIGLLSVSLAPAFGKWSRVVLMTGLSVYSVSIAIYVVAWFPLLKGVVPPEERGLFFSRLRISWQTASGIFLLGAAALVKYTSSIIAFQVIIALAALVGFARISLLKRLPEDAPSKPEPLRATLSVLLRNRSLTGFAAYLFWLYFFASNTMQVAVIMASRSLKIGNDFLILLSAGMMLGSIAGYYVGGQIVDRRGTKAAFLIGHFGFAALNLAMLAVRSASRADMGILLTTGSLYGMVLALSSIAVSSEAFHLVPRKQQEVGMAVCLLLYFAARGLSRFLAGWALDSGMLAPEWILAGTVMTPYHTLFLINGCGVIASCALLAMIPSLLAKSGDSPPLR